MSQVLINQQNKLLNQIKHPQKRQPFQISFQFLTANQISIAVDASNSFPLIKFYQIEPEFWFKQINQKHRFSVFEFKQDINKFRNIVECIKKYSISYSLVDCQILLNKKVRIKIVEIPKTIQSNLIFLVKKLPSKIPIEDYQLIQLQNKQTIKEPFTIVTYQKKSFVNIFKKILNQNHFKYMINRERKQFIINQQKDILSQNIHEHRIKLKYKIISVTNYLRVRFFKDSPQIKPLDLQQLLKKSKFKGSIIYDLKQFDIIDCIITIDQKEKAYSFASFQILYYYLEFKGGKTRFLCDFIEQQQTQAKLKLFYNYQSQSNSIPLLQPLDKKLPQQQWKRIKQFISMLKKSDYAQLSKYWNDYNNDIIQDIDFIINNWSVHVTAYEIIMEDFIKVINAKIMNIDQKSRQVVYKGLSNLKKKIVKKIEMFSDKKMSLEQLNTDILYQHFLQQLNSKEKREGSYYIRDTKRQRKMPISQFIALSQDFFPRRQWHEIFLRDQIKYYSAEQRQYKKTYLNNITECKISNLKCLGCTQFFYQRQNIDDPDIQVNIAVLSSVQKISDLAVQIRDQICCFLNNGGGVIFFDCIQQYLNTIVIGSYVTKNQMARLQQVINGYIKDIYPPISFGTQLDVSFVPVASHYLFQSIENRNEAETFDNTCGSTSIGTVSNEIKLKYIQGKYVLRIRVYASKSPKFYFWDNKDNKESRQQIIFVDKFKNRQIIKIKGQKIIKKMKSKFYTHYAKKDSNYKDELQRLLNLPSIQYHQINLERCAKPQVGFPTTQQKKKDDNSNSNPLQLKYKYMSLIVAKKKYHQEIKTKLKDKKIDCQIQTKFQQYKFKAAGNSAILYHNMRFDHLLAQVSYNKEFQFEGRYVLIILITPYIKLSERTLKNQMPKDDFDSLKDWMVNQFPKEHLRMIRFQTETKEYEYYLESQSKTALLFMYYILNHYNQKAVFKNPKNYDKLSPQQKQKRLVEIHANKVPDDPYKFAQTQKYRVQSQKYDYNQLSKVNDKKNGKSSKMKGVLKFGRKQIFQKSNFSKKFLDVLTQKDISDLFG